MRRGAMHVARERGQMDREEVVVCANPVPSRMAKSKLIRETSYERNQRQAASCTQS